MQFSNHDVNKVKINNGELADNERNSPTNSDVDQMDNQTIIERYSLRQWKLPKFFRNWKRNKASLDQSNTLFGNDDVKLVGSSVFYHGEIQQKYHIRSYSSTSKINDVGTEHTAYNNSDLNSVLINDKLDIARKSDSVAQISSKASPYMVTNLLNFPENENATKPQVAPKSRDSNQKLSFSKQASSLPKDNFLTESTYAMVNDEAYTGPGIINTSTEPIENRTASMNLRNKFFESTTIPTNENNNKIDNKTEPLKVKIDFTETAPNLLCEKPLPESKAQPKKSAMKKSPQSPIKQFSQTSIETNAVTSKMLAIEAASCLLNRNLGDNSTDNDEDDVPRTNLSAKVKRNDSIALMLERNRKKSADTPVQVVTSVATRTASFNNVLTPHPVIVNIRRSQTVNDADYNMMSAERKLEREKIETSLSRRISQRPTFEDLTNRNIIYQKPESERIEEKEHLKNLLSNKLSRRPTVDELKSRQILRFKDYIEVTKADDYDRRSEKSWTKLTPKDKAIIRQELNEFKSQMEVHSDSKKYTRFHKS